MSRIVLLSRPHNWQAVRTLDECARRGLEVSAVILEPKTTREKLRRLWRFLKSNGVHDTARKILRTLRARRDFRHHITHGEASALPLAVATMAARMGVTVYNVGSHNDEQCQRVLRDLAPDLILLAGTRIIKPHIIERARVGCLNAHTGWLPEYRGVHANLWALLEGGKLGITVHYVDPGVDTGAILLREQLPVHTGDTLEILEARMTAICARLMADAVLAIEAGTTNPIPQARDEGRQYRALPFDKEQEVRRLLESGVSGLHHASQSRGTS